jgi:putative membrane protein insertion efficiency factor
VSERIGARLCTIGRAIGRGLWLLPRRLLIGLVHAYRLLLKAWLGNSCRFEPTCSAYMLQALERHGAVAGTALGGWRLLRCHPWCDGGVDPVPDTFAAARAAPPPGRPGLFTRLLPPQRPTPGAGSVPGTDD